MPSRPEETEALEAGDDPLEHRHEADDGQAGEGGGEKQVRRRDTPGFLLERRAKRCHRFVWLIQALIRESAQQLHVCGLRVETNSLVELLHGLSQSPSLQIYSAKRRAHTSGKGNRSSTNLRRETRLDLRYGSVPLGQPTSHGFDGRTERGAFIATQSICCVDKVRYPFKECILDLRL